MTYVVTEPCIMCKYMECVAICPVMCFHEGVNFLVIDPDECIDCDACVEPCPVDAIYPEEELPEKWHSYIELNADYAKRWPVISEPREPLPTAEEFENVQEKAHLLDPNPGPGDPDEESVPAH